MTQAPVTYADVESCVDATIARVGRRILLGTPLGLGKANHLVNEFFRRACEDPRIDLRIFTALTLARPRWKSELERRFLESILAPYRARNQLQPFPFGTDLTPEEVVLAKALQGLKRIKDLLKRAVVYALASVEAI